MSDIINVIVISNRDKYYEYTVSNTDDALDRYIKEELGFESRFSATEAFWNGIKHSVDKLEDKINLANGFCNRDRNKIKKIYTDCLPVYPLFVRFLSNDGFKVYNANTFEELTEVNVRAGESMPMYVIADRGCKISEISYTMATSNSTNTFIAAYDEKSNFFEIKNITGQVFVNVTVQPIEGDWQVTRDIDVNLSTKNQKTVLKAGESYYDIITPASKQHLPEVRIYMNGTDITSAVYTFDIEQWCGIIDFSKTNVDGHIYIKAAAETIDVGNLPDSSFGQYIYDLGLSLLGPSECEVEFINNFSGLSYKCNPKVQQDDPTVLVIPNCLNYWTDLSATIILPDIEYNYEIDDVTITMADIDITDKCKININEAFKNRVFLNASDITGNINISVTVKAI